MVNFVMVQDLYQIAVKGGSGPGRLRMRVHTDIAELILWDGISNGTKYGSPTSRPWLQCEVEHQVQGEHAEPFGRTPRTSRGTLVLHVCNLPRESENGEPIADSNLSNGVGLKNAAKAAASVGGTVALRRNVRGPFRGTDDALLTVLEIRLPCVIVKPVAAAAVSPPQSVAPFPAATPQPSERLSLPNGLRVSGDYPSKRRDASSRVHTPATNPWAPHGC